MSNKSSSTDTEPIPVQELRASIDSALSSGDAESAFRIAKVLSHRPHLGVWEEAAIGRAALAKDQYDLAIKWLSKAHESLPQEIIILRSLAESYAVKKLWDAAALALGKAINLQPGLAELYKLQGIYWSNCGRYEEAEQSLYRGLSLDPNNPSFLTLLGELCLAQDKLPDAIKYFNRVLTKDPMNIPAISNLALAYEREGDLRLTLDMLGSLIQIEPSHANIYRRGQVLLTMGRFREGWLDYARRLQSGDYQSWQFALNIPYWSGEDLSDKHLLVWTDQGLGDQILAVSLLGELVPRARKITLACDPRLISLFQRSWPELTVVSLAILRNAKKNLAPIQVQATISELGATLRPNYKSFSQPKAFLKSDKERSIELRRRLTKDEQRPLIGISWRSSNPLAGKQKSTSLCSDWAQVLKQSGMRFVALQYGAITEELKYVREALAVDIATIPEIDFERDVDGFASLVAAMDQVISVSNTAVHVAGGLGISTKALLPHTYGRPWYWFDKGDVALWYPNVSLYRSQGDWERTIGEVAESLLL
ncbi:MAG: tetratricopeptide repeat protein [Rhodospirillaceae bacterium]